MGTNGAMATRFMPKTMIWCVSATSKLAWQITAPKNKLLLLKQIVVSWVFDVLIRFGSILGQIWAPGGAGELAKASWNLWDRI